MSTTSLTADARESHPRSPQPPLSATARMGVSVVVPLYNERDCIPQLVAALDRVEQALRERFDFEFVLVDDGSVDETVALLTAAVGDRPTWRIVRHAVNRGIAAAIQTGIRAAAHDVAASIDCDGSYDPLLLAEMAPRLVDGVDLVTASPYHPGGGVENVPRWRLQLSRLASRLYGLACRHKLTCYTSCYRVYRRDAVAPIELENERFVGVAELLWRVLERGGQVVEHPARLRARAAGQSKMRVIRAALGHLRLIMRIFRRRLLH
jgi:dolichol-phosphate mannosyltransferase